jgi:hypothetical protein
VDDAAPVRVRERVADVLQQAHDLTDREGAHARDALGQRLALDQPHRVREVVGRFLHRVHRHDVGMREAGGDPRLEQEPIAQPCLVSERRQQDLERDEAIEPDVPRKVHRPHTPAPELALERVTAGERAAHGFQIERR